MTLFLLSLAGVPPAGGFQGKLYLIFSALGSGAGSPAVWLVGGLVVTTGVSAYAYLRVVTTMFRKGDASTDAPELLESEAAAAAYGGSTNLQGVGGGESQFSWALAVVVAIAVIGTLYLGVAPQSVLALTSHVLPLP